MLFQSVCGHLIFSVRYHFSAVRNTLIFSDFRITILLHFHTIKHSDLFDLTSFFFSIAPFLSVRLLRCLRCTPLPLPPQETPDRRMQLHVRARAKIKRPRTFSFSLFQFIFQLSFQKNSSIPNFGFIVFGIKFSARLERGMITEKQASRYENQKFSPVKLWFSIKLIATE